MVHDSQFLANGLFEGGLLVQELGCFNHRDTTVDSLRSIRDRVPECLKVTSAQVQKGSVHLARSQSRLKAGEQIESSV